MGADVVIIGAGVNGLVAATYLARAGAHVTLLEADAMPGGVCANRVPVGAYAVPAGPLAFAALDPRVLKDLNLTRLGLGFAVRDLPLTLLQGGDALTLWRDLHETRRSLTVASAKDGERYGAFRRSLFAFARDMRALWWEEGTLTDEPARASLRRLQVTSALAFIENAFESETARAAFAFDVLAADPTAAGGALVLAWAAAQEMCGLQGAVAIPLGGPEVLVETLVAAANGAGVDIRLNAEVARLALDGEAMRGAVLATGETVEARIVVSGLTRKKTLLEFLPPGAAGFAAARRIEQSVGVGEARLVLALKECPPPFARPARYRIGEKFESAAVAYSEAQAGRIAPDFFLEAIALDPSETPASELPSDEPHEMLLSVAVRPVPVAPHGGWKAATARLVPMIVRALEHHAPGLAASITGLGFVPPAECDALNLADLAAPWTSRIVTPVRGLYLCGAAAEPVPCVSGRAGRIAAAIVAQQLKEAAP